MRTRLELTRFGLRILGLCLLLWCWWQVVGVLSMIAGAALVGNWKVVQFYLQGAWADATRFIIRDLSPSSGPKGPPMMGLNWPLLTWWFRLGAGLWLVCWNARLARHLWRGIANDARCPHCGYDRTGLAPTAKCPECGSM